MSSAQNIINGIFGTQAKRGGWQPGPSGGRLPLLLLVVGLLVLWGAFSAFYTVQPEQRAVVKRFGSVAAIADPGLHFKLALMVDKVQLVVTERVLKEAFGFLTVGYAQPQRFATPPQNRKDK